MDDMAETRHQLQVLLRSKGFEVVEAGDGSEALKKAHEARPDLIISDILMPVMDGFALCRACKKDPVLQFVPFVFYPATYTDPKDEELALSIGADRFVVKPVENDAFIEIISSLVSSEAGVRLRQPVSPDVERPTLECDTGYLQQYNQALVRKLEDKLLQLDATKRELEEEIRHRERAEAALRESQQGLREIYEKMPVGYHSLDPQGRLLDVNPFWLGMFGYAPEEVIGRPLTDFLSPDSRAEFEKRFPIFRDSNKATTIELEFRCKNGEVRTIEVRGVFEHDREGRPSHSHCILADVTERKRLDSVNQAFLLLGKGLSEARSAADVARHIFAAADQLWQWDAATFDRLNMAEHVAETVIAVDTLDAQRREVMVEQPRAALSPLLKKVVQQGAVLIDVAREGEADLSLEPLVKHGCLPVCMTAAPITHQGEVLAVVSIRSCNPGAFDNEDLQVLKGLADLCGEALERIDAQKRLEQSQERLAMAIESTGLGTWDWDLVTGKIVWGGHHARLFGLRPDEFDGTYECFEARLHPEDRELVATAVKRALEKHEDYECEYRVIWPDGSVHWILGHGRFIYDSDGRAVRMVGVVRETTQQRLAQDRLKESEQRFRSLYDNSVLGLYRTTPDGRIVMANPALVRLLGYSSFEELAQINLETEGFHPRYPRSLFREAIEREGTVRGLESAWVRKDGSIVYVSESAQAVRDQHGKIVFYDGTVEDITEYRQAQLRLERQAALLEAATDAIHVRSPDGVVSYWNSASEHTLGWKREEALGRKITELGLKDVAAFTAAESALLKERAWSGEIKFETKGGKPLIMFCRWTLLPEKPGEPAEILAIHTDITEKRDIEARYLRAQRLEGIGALASGIAHDLNNVLSPIVLGASLLRDKSISPEFQASIEMIQSSAQRGANIVRQLLTFARGLKGENIPIHLQHLIRDTGRLIRETFPRNITYYELCPRDLWPIIGDSTQIQQVLLNLSVNARDAMPSGGSLKIAAANKQLDSQFLSTVDPGIREGPFVVVEVSDTGHGMTKEVLDHLFEPFFTTKEPGTGTGLGLATSHGIVRSHGGFILVNSTPGQGSVFSVYLPAVPDALSQAGPAQVQAPCGQGELILVVDDELEIREVTKRTLEKGGYRVLVAEDGAAGISVYTKYRERIDLVITDLLMPVMDGLGLASALHRIDPRLPIIVSTGDSTSPNQAAKIAQLEKLGVKVFLQKPYGTNQLLQAIHSVLHPE
ncbi:MAG: PAS domain S-box protein [Verrucomicrobiia bacterium]